MAVLLIALLGPGATESLPAPPADLARLYDRGNVSFVFYPDDESERRFPALTRFDFAFQYKASHTYRAVRTRSGRVLVVKPRFSDIRFVGTHHIELPASFRGADLYDRPLVRHEFDHVRISADPRWAEQFRQRVNRLREIRVPLEPEAPVTAAQADRAIKAAIEKVFRDIRALIEIRYQELDRLTRHGRKVLPEGYWGRFNEDVATSDSKGSAAAIP